VIVILCMHAIRTEKKKRASIPFRYITTNVQAMQTARMDLKLSQKDVAQKINEKPSVLQDYESGKAIPNAQILSKLERVLGVKLRGTSPSF